MRSIGYPTCMLLATVALTGGPAFANICQTARFTCPTTMPIDGYCECTAHGVTEDGTVVASAKSHRSDHRASATAGGCGANPQAPGCQ